MSFCYSAERLCTSVASVADSHMLPALLHGEERKVWGDGGYQGQTEAIKEAAPKAQDMTSRRTKFKDYEDELQKKKNRSKSSIRAKVEHPFRILKRVFGFDKVRYRGIAKNHNRLCANFALVNLYLHSKRLVALGAECAQRPESGLAGHRITQENHRLRRSIAEKHSAQHPYTLAA